VAYSGSNQTLFINSQQVHIGPAIMILFPVEQLDAQLAYYTTSTSSAVQMGPTRIYCGALTREEVIFDVKKVTTPEEISPDFPLGVSSWDCPSWLMITISGSSTMTISRPNSAPHSSLRTWRISLKEFPPITSPPMLTNSTAQLAIVDKHQRQLSNLLIDWTFSKTWYSALALPTACPCSMTTQASPNSPTNPLGPPWFLWHWPRECCPMVVMALNSTSTPLEVLMFTLSPLVQGISTLLPSGSQSVQ